MSDATPSDSLTSAGRSSFAEEVAAMLRAVPEVGAFEIVSESAIEGADVVQTYERVDEQEVCPVAKAGHDASGICQCEGCRRLRDMLKARTKPPPAAASHKADPDARPSVESLVAHWRADQHDPKTVQTPQATNRERMVREAMDRARQRYDDPLNPRP